MNGNVDTKRVMGGAFEEMLREEGIEHLLTTPYVPSSYGLAERTVNTLIDVLRMCCEKVNEWDLYVGKLCGKC